MHADTVEVEVSDEVKDIEEGAYIRRPVVAKGGTSTSRLRRSDGPSLRVSDPAATIGETTIMLDPSLPLSPRLVARIRGPTSTLYVGTAPV